MKKLGIFLALLAINIGITFAYTPTSGETQQLNTIKGVLNTVSSADLRRYYQQFSQLQTTVGNQDEKLEYRLTHLRDYSYSQFSSQKNFTKQQHKSEKENFLTQYQSGLLLEGDVYQNCLGRYNSLDNLSFANDFPTALTIAVRYRESTCGYTLPRNGDGPFQIVSKEYGTGEINEKIFLQTVQDFLEFSQTKIDRYNDRNAAENLSIDLSYTGASYTDLLRFAALYNGLSGGTVYGEITPTAPKYFFEGYENDIRTGEHKKDGIFAKYLKVLEWELKQ